MSKFSSLLAKHAIFVSFTDAPPEGAWQGHIYPMFVPVSIPCKVLAYLIKLFGRQNVTNKWACPLWAVGQILPNPYLLNRGHPSFFIFDLTQNSAYSLKKSIFMHFPTTPTKGVGPGHPHKPSHSPSTFPYQSSAHLVQRFGCL